VFFAAPGAPSFFLLPPDACRGDGAPTGATSVFALLSAARPAGRARRSALHRGFSVPGAVLPGVDGGTTPTVIRAAFAALHPRRVQPSKAVPRSGDGRRTRGLPSARLRASPAGAAPAGVALAPFRPTQVAPSSRRLAKTPSA